MKCIHFFGIAVVAVALIFFTSHVGAMNDATQALIKVLESDQQTSDFEKLIDAEGVDVNATDNEGDTALMWASLYGHVDIVKKLLEKKVNVNKVNNKGDTALIVASMSGYADIVKLLLDAGVEMYVKNNEEKTALVYASEQKHADVVQLLEEYQNKVLHDLASALKTLAS
jgi:ankyrin repeat protein